MWSLRLFTPPATEPVSLGDVKAQLRVDFDDDDTLLTGYITAARVWAEEFTSRSLITQTWELGLSGFPYKDRILLPRGPVQSVTSVTYTDSGENAFTLTAGTNYLLDQFSDPAQVVLPFNQFWPTAVLSTRRPVVIRFVAGYGATGASVPASIGLAMQQIIGTWYQNRESIIVSKTASSVIPVPSAAELLLDTYRLRYSGPA